MRLRGYGNAIVPQAAALFIRAFDDAVCSTDIRHTGYATGKRKSMANGSQSMGVCLSDLNMQVQAWAGWPTPTTRDHKDGKECPNVPLNALLGRVAWLTANPQAARITADGTMLTGCSAGMESGGQLNPAFSGWLQGFPEAWCRAAISCQLPTRLRKAPKRPVA